jgi:hypothetical protein
MSEDRVPYSAAPTCLIPVLQVPWEELRRGVRDTLFALHQERMWKQGRPGEEGVLAQIAFWEAVLGWLKEHKGTSVNLVGEKRE